MNVRLRAQGTDIESVPKDEHSKLGSVKRVVDEISCFVAVGMLDTNPSTHGIFLMNIVL